VVVVPATTKGWIDRVWNNGWAYGEGADGKRRLKHSHALLIGSASGDAPSYAKRRYDEAMRTQLLTGIMDYCGIPRAELALLYDVMAGAPARQRHLETVRQLGATWFR
jgi:NAD(P)H dehydrogenase (quinone)